MSMRGGNNKRSLLREPQRFDIGKLSHEGRGIANYEGRVVFVDGALPGEQVEARFTGGRATWAEARTLQVLVAAADRVEPPCPYHGTCGGCSLQHFAATAQLAFKEAVLHERLTHAIGDTGYTRLPVLSGEVLGYRRKARLAVRYVSKKGKALVGFRERHSAFITDMDTCLILDPQVAKLLPTLSTLIGSLHNFQHIPQIEVAVGDPGAAECNCALVFRHLLPLTEQDRARLSEYGQTQGVAIYLQPKGPDSVTRLYPATGEERLYYCLPEFGLRLAFHPLDFTQVNADINRRMLVQALDLLDPQPGERVLDLFCGLGNFTLPLATRALSVLGVEGSADMVRRGGENAERNGITNATFVTADLTLPPEQHTWLQAGFDKVLLDPPRSGAQEVLPAVIAAAPKRIVYVSCNPATLARDAALLQEQGYRLCAAGAMDMFPHTSHVEAMAVFDPERKRS